MIKKQPLCFRRTAIFTLPLAMMASCLSNDVNAQSRDEKVIRDRDTVTKEGSWLYDDVEKGFAAATKSKKPLMVVLRCIP